MAKARKRTGKKAPGRKKKKPARRKPAARRGKMKRKAMKRKPSFPARTAAAPAAPRPIVIPGAWPFPMGGKSQ